MRKDLAGIEKPCQRDAAACFADAVTRTKVAYVPGVNFYADGSGKNTLRLNYSNSTNEQIEKGMKLLGDYFKN